MLFKHEPNLEHVIDMLVRYCYQHGQIHGDVNSKPLKVLGTFLCCKYFKEMFILVI